MTIAQDAGRSSRYIMLFAMLGMVSCSCLAQKVDVGYDRGTDFSKFKTYTWTEPAMPPTRPIAFGAAVAKADAELQAKGLIRVATDGDLTLTPAGGVDFGFAWGGQHSHSSDLQRRSAYDERGHVDRGERSFLRRKLCFGRCSRFDLHRSSKQ